MNRVMTDAVQVSVSINQQMECSRIEGNGMESHRMFWNGMEWNRTEQEGMECSGMK